MFRLALAACVVVVIGWVAVAPAYALSSGEIKDVSLGLSSVDEEVFTVVEGVKTMLTATALSPGMGLEWDGYREPDPPSGSPSVVKLSPRWTGGPNPTYILPDDTAPGTYHLRFRPWQAGNPGTLRVCYETWPGATTDGSISSGQTKTLDLQNGLWRTLSFSGGAGNRVALFGTTDGMDILDEYGNHTPAVVEDHWATTRVWVLPASGTYVIYAHTLPGSEGPHALTMVQFPSAARGIASGQTRSGILSKDQVDVYSFEGTVGERVYLRTAAPTGTSATWPMLLAPSGLIPFSVEPGMPRDFTLTETGTWYLIYYERNLLGSHYGVTFLRQAGPYTAGNDLDGGPIRSGETKTGTFGLGDMDAYSITASAGDVLAMRFDTSAWTSAYVIAPDGSSDWMNWASSLHPLTQTGRYVIMGWSDARQSYNVTAILRSGAQTSPDDPDGGTLVSNDIVSGTMPPADLDAYKITGNAGDLIFLRPFAAAPGASGVWTEVVGPDNSLVVPQSWHTHGFKLPATGAYWVVATQYLQTTPTKYQLSYLKLPGRLTSPEDPDGGPIYSGDFRAGHLARADFDAFSFAGAANDNLHAVMSSASATLEKRIELWGPDGELITQQEGEITQTLTKAGTYYLVLYDETGSHAANYSLQFSLYNRVPRVIWTSPARGDTRANPGQLSVRFSSGMRPETVAANLSLTGPGGANAPFTLNWVNASEVTITPTPLLAFDSDYTLTVGTGCTSVENYPMVKNYVLSFHTAPSVIASTNPADGATNVSRTAPIQVTFRSPVVTTTVPSRLSLRLAGGAAVSATITWTTPGSVLQFRPTTTLLAGKRYILRLGAGVQLASGETSQWVEQMGFRTGTAATAVSLVAAAAPTAAGCEIRLRLSEGANVSADIRNLAGRVVVALPAQRVPSGASSLLWNGRSASGTKAPPGSYLVTVTARTDDGQQAQSCVPLRMTH